MPSQARSIWPFVRSSSYFSRASALGIAKLIPWYDGAEDGRVDADDLAFDVHQRAAAVARIHGRVGLQIFLIRAAADVAAAAARFGADDAERQAALQPVRAAERPHQVADFELVAVAPFGGDQIVEVDLQHGDVGHRVGADDRCVGRAAIAEPDLRPFRAPSTT